MSIFAWIIVGLLAGWLAERITGRNHGLLMNLCVGVVGAIVGGFLFGSILGFDYPRGLNIASILVATAGAVVTLTLLGWSRTGPSLDERAARHLPGDRSRSGWR
ncbi:MAG: GlsB/YeaQ/YmgE family stress response membrane protein [Hyphomicrobiaceae bacterium]